MAQSTRETERKYTAPSAGDGAWPPDLTAVKAVASVAPPEVDELDAVYHDTADLRLTRTGASLRRRTGGPDAGWHLKLPLPGDSREEVRAPLGSEDVPAELRELVVARTRGAPLGPVVRIRSTRSRWRLLDSRGRPLAELSTDVVHAEALVPGGGHATWTETEVELADGAGSQALLDRVEKVLREHGAERAQSPSKVARALAETTTLLDGAPDRQPPARPRTAGDHVLAYLRRLTGTLVDLDPAVRRDTPDAVHRMRTTARRLRGCLRSYRPVLDREATDPIRRDLKWLAGELGVARDHEVLHERLGRGVEALPGEVVLGPVTARLQAWDAARRPEARRRTLDALASPRYLGLLDRLDALVAEPPLRAKADGEPGKVMAKALRKEYGRLARRMERALGTPAGPERDTAVHEARKAAKRLRYAAETARPALGRPAARLRKRVKTVQQVSGAHHDGVVARQTLRRLAVAAHAAGEPGFTWGLLYGREAAAGDTRERQLPEAWRRARAAARHGGLVR
ncbi:CYTH and CHAD domain-containing protein [Streptomyces sp. LP11]|uniref:CYTH and CHAD domain-containing protein n=1 Tax=Streptomyces pyxinicus TaxID=2970331 RepID=A0ABT2B7J7_9ACTN|nr:CYTH and CHAD domain-containing protein [Streptomyces sp. LP11]MCS0604351.1 CYTH and CHAD domain-containing protein [Streptomyces sp. LP11]